MPRPSSLVTPADLCRLVVVSDASIAPDGSRVAFVHRSVDAQERTRTAIWEVAAEGGTPPREITRGPRDSQPRWRPDGGALAFVRGDAKLPPQLFVLDGRGGEARAVTRLPWGTLGAFAWMPDGRRILFSWRRMDPAFTPDAARERESRGAPAPPRVIDEPWYRLDGDGYFGADRFHLWLVDAERGTLAKVFDEDRTGDMSFDVLPDGSGAVVACNRHPRALFEAGTEELLRLDLRRVRLRAAATPAAFERLHAGRAAGSAAPIAGIPAGPKGWPRVSPCGRRLAWAGRRGRVGMYDPSNLELWCAELRGARAAAVRSLTRGHDVCLMAPTLSDCADAAFGASLAWAADSASLFCRIGHHGSGRIASVAVEGKPSLRFHTPSGCECSFAGPCADGTRLPLVVSTPIDPPRICVAEVEGAEFPLRSLTTFNDDWLARRRLSVPEERWVRSGRGHVQAWVMRPPRGAPERRGAAILMVHGGPHAQYGTSFFHEFQCVAAAGWTVVFSNPRGSKGYGAAFASAIRGSWGRADWADVQAVTRFMGRLPGVDRGRLAIAGGSYGGYMTNWAIGHTKVFRAAITDRCVSNLVSMQGTSDHMDVPDRYWRGAAWDRPETLWSQSPIAHMKGVTTPTLIIHSEGDLRCNVEQGEQVHAALSVQGVPCRFVRYPASTSHGMSRGGPPPLRIHRLHEMLSWLERWLAPARTAAAPRRTRGSRR
ncbi:MAG: S9 family peptidase [Phycisphaerales bacterium]